MGFQESKDAAQRPSHDLAAPWGHWSVRHRGPKRFIQASGALTSPVLCSVPSLPGCGVLPTTLLRGPKPQGLSTGGAASERL